MLDLSSLDTLTAVPTTAGAPMLLAISLIDPDPDQPRREFDQDALAELEQSIRERGVISPISVRPNPGDPGRWIINFGERRYRASASLGLAEIPAFVHETHIDYDQVIENLQREELSPMALARFVIGKVGEGVAPAEVAKRLGKGPSFITEHLALVDMPKCIGDLYEAGKIRSARTVYDLRRLYGEWPDQVEVWCSTAQDVSRRAVQDLANRLNRGGAQEAAVAMLASDLAAGVDSDDDSDDDSGPKTEVQADGQDTGDETGDSGPEAAHLDGPDQVGSWPTDEVSRGDALECPAVDRLPAHNAEHEKSRAPTKPADPTKLKKPVLLVEFDDRAAMVLVNKRPTMPGLLHIKYEDNGEEVEIDARRCVINCLIEGTA